MSTLVLEMRPGDMMVVNGAPIRFRNRVRIELAAKARFLFGKQLMAPEAATTPARRIYFALQTAYIGTDAERAEGLAAARDLIAAFQEATTSAQARAMLDDALALAEADECYRALRLARRVMLHESEVLGLSAPDAGRADPRRSERGRPRAAAGADHPLRARAAVPDRRPQRPQGGVVAGEEPCDAGPDEA
jgi:flagellar protein FlbT